MLLKKDCLPDKNEGRLIRTTFLTFLLCVTMTVFMFGIGGIGLILDGNYSFIGWLSVVLCPALLAWLFIERKNSYICVTEDGIEECDIRKRKKYLPWDHCEYVGLRRAGNLADLVCSRHIPDKNQRGEIPYDYQWPEKSTIRVPWRLISEQDKDFLRNTIKESAMRPEVKAEFLAQYGRD